MNRPEGSKETVVDMIIDFLSSLRLTLILLLLLAFVAIWGTIIPIDGRFELFYQSLWFRLLLFSLAVNIGVCTAKTIRRNLGQRKSLLEILRSEQPFALSPRYVLSSAIPLETVFSRLKGQGYRVFGEESAMIGLRGLSGKWGAPLVHLSFLLIMAGALCGEFGFVGTLNIYVGDSSKVYFDWDKQEDRPLGFTFRLDRFEPVYYPVELRFNAIDPESQEVLESYTAREGDTVSLPQEGMTARIVRFNVDDPLFLLEIYKKGHLLGEYRVTPDQESFGDGENPGIRLRPTQYRDPLLKQLHSEVTLLREGGEVTRGVIEVNHPLVFEGMSIYQTAYNKDDEGKWFAGFQFSRDPGEGLVWVGCIMLLLGLFMAFFIPYRAVGIVRKGDELLLVGFAGFRGEGGALTFEKLERGLTDSGGE